MSTLEEIKTAISSSEDEGSLVIPNEGPKEQPSDLPPGEIQDQWSPDWKYKVLDQEYEIDEFLRPAITKDKYPEVIDLLTKAKGFDHYKSKMERLNSEIGRLKPIEEEYSQQNKLLGYMGTLLKEKDYENLFKELKINDEDVTRYALNRVKYQQLPEDQRLEYDRNIENSKRLRQLEMQNREYEQQVVSQSVQQRSFELDNFLSTQMKDVAESFDSRAGRPGAFREAVIRQGQLAFYTQKRDLSVPEAAEEVLKLYGRPQPQGPASAPIAENNSMQSKPHIPNLKGTNQSVVKTQVRSIDDLKKLAQQYEG